MIGWDDLVTTALLGTDRRPLPAEPSRGPTPEPAARVLDLAAQHRAVLLAGSPLRRGHPAPVAPGERLPMAPKAAQELLNTLLATAEPGLVNDWLSVCTARSLGVAPELWPRLASRAARSSAYDRRLVAVALGPRGRWFVQQNPLWARLGSVDLATATPTRSGDPEAALARAGLGEAPVRVLELLLDCPDPWPTSVTVAALRLVMSGELGAGTRAAALSLGLRIPLTQADDLAAWIDDQSLPVRAPLPTLRAVQLGLVLLERTISSRIEIRDAFAESSAGAAERPTGAEQASAGEAPT